MNLNCNKSFDKIVERRYNGKMFIAVAETYRFMHQDRPVDELATRGLSSLTLAETLSADHTYT